MEAHEWSGGSGIAPAPLVPRQERAGPGPNHGHWHGAALFHTGAERALPLERGNHNRAHPARPGHCPHREATVSCVPFLKREKKKKLTPCVSLGAPICAPRLFSSCLVPATGRGDWGCFFRTVDRHVHFHIQTPFLLH